jgi:streptogramin lyase
MLHGARDVAAGGGAVWVASRNEAEIVQVDRATGEVVDGAPAGEPPHELAFGGGAIWSANADATVTQTNARTHARIALTVGPGLSAIDFCDGEVWVASLPDNAVTRIDAGDLRATDQPVRTCLTPVGLTITAPAVWVACAGDSSLQRIPHP